MLQYFRSSTSQYQTGISALTLMAFLFALFVHAKHSAQQILVLEKQDCYVCQQSLDAPPKTIIILPVNNCVAELAFSFIAANIARFNYYYRPQLRAPPSFL